MITPRQIELVRKSLRALTLVGEQAAALFYVRLFELDPTLRPAVRGDLLAQGRKLLGMLARIVEALDQPDRLELALRDLDCGELEANLREQRVDAVRATLRWTLRLHLGAAYTLEVEEAWTAAFATCVAAARIDPAAPPSAA
ncbi:MAG TPA: hypothetical protein VHF69_07440 [Candidatus Synoicihabitans sp.]|nr:hypothetical protein [Candidatus Synoicihabitans sp.]